MFKKFGTTKAIKKEKEDTTTKQRKKTKPKCRKSFILETDSEEDNFSINENNLCDDDELDKCGYVPAGQLDYVSGVDNEETSFICREFGRDMEVWFRCTSCGLWVHSLWQWI